MTVPVFAFSLFVLMQAGTGSIEGTVVNATTNKPIPAAQVTGMRIPAPASAAGTNADGTFQIQGVLTWRVSVNVVGLPSGPQATLYVKEARFGSIDALSQTFMVSGPVSDQLEIVFGRNAGQISGIVTDNRSHPLAAVQVALVPDRRERRDLYKLTATGSNGQFAFTTVPPGRYKVVTVTDLDANAVFDPDVMRQFEQNATAVNVGESANITVELKLSPPPAR